MWPVCVGAVPEPERTGLSGLAKAPALRGRPAQPPGRGASPSALRGFPAAPQREPAWPKRPRPGPAGESAEHSWALRSGSGGRGGGRPQEGTRGCRCAGSLGATAGTRLSRPIPCHGAAGGTPALRGHALRCPAHHETVAHRPTGLRQGDDTSDPASPRRSRPEFKSRALTKRCF